MNKNNWIWMPHPGHLIVSRNCGFFLNTYVGSYLISTVGEYLPDESSREIIANQKGITLKGRGDERRNDFINKHGYVEIGCERLYETMVFKAGKSKNKCCLYEASDYSEIDADGYNAPEEAFKGHYKLCKKWANIKKGKRKKPNA